MAPGNSAGVVLYSLYKPTSNTRQSRQTKPTYNLYNCTLHKDSIKYTTNHQYTTKRIRCAKAHYAQVGYAAAMS
eukprot:682475-Amorphochlora_amoeboformis.AAC.1